ncbi:MAG: extracellular solute-binding protein [Clostridiaceae bacterium]
MKRFPVLCLLTAAIAAVSFAQPSSVARAEGGGEQSDSESASAGTVKVWFGANEEENAVLRQIAERFEQETGIAVEVVARRAIFDAPTDLVNYAQLEEAPDIVYMQAPDIGTLVRSGFLEPLDFSAETKSRFTDVAFSAFSLNGSCYGVGYNNSTSGLLYNKTLISEDELPKTWDGFFATAERLTLPDVKGWYSQFGKLLNVRNMWFVYPIIKECGGYYYGRLADGTYNPYDVGLDSAGMLQYVEKMKELQQKGLILGTRVASESNIVSAFGEGKVAMMLYGLWSADYLKGLNLDYGIAPLPAGSNGEASRPLTTVEGFVVNHYSRHPSAAKQFLNYMLEDENQQSLIEAGNGYAQKTGARNPTNMSVIASDYIQSDDILKNLSAIGENSEPFPNIPEGTIWYNYTTTAFGTIFYGDSSGKAVDAEVKLHELADAVRADVARMNETTERVDIPWWAFAVCGVLFVLGVSLAFFRRQKRRAQNPLELPARYPKHSALIGWGLMTPLICLLALFYIYPILHNIALSLTNYSSIHLSDYEYVGAANYKNILTEGVQGLLSMLLWTVLFAVSVVTLAFILGTFIATLLERVGVRVGRAYRVVFILPWVIPTVITLLMWQGLLETDGGLVNQLLGLVGVPAIPWLSDPVWARVSSILVMVWFAFPYFMVVAFGILKSIPRDYFEAARIDGASNAHIFRSITLPIVFKAMKPTLIMSLIMQFNQFGIYLLTQGGPASDKLGAPGATDLLITYIFNTAFNTGSYAKAAAYSVILFLFIGTFSLVAMNRGSRKEAE